MLDSEVNKIKKHLRPIHTEADYNRTVKIMNALLDMAEHNEDHPLSSLLDLTPDISINLECSNKMCSEYLDMSLNSEA